MKLSEPQRLVLLNLLAGRPPLDHVRGRSEFGGYTRTLYSMKRHGWIDRDCSITEVGRRIMATDTAP